MFFPPCSDSVTLQKHGEGRAVIFPRLVLVYMENPRRDKIYRDRTCECRMEVCTPPPLPTGATLALALAEPTLLAVALVLALEVALEVVAALAPAPRTRRNHAS